MNKFVKGAKNLAFALSFVTIAACGGVKKADLDTLGKSFNEKIGGKADKDSCVSKNELASLKSEIGNEVGEKIKNGVEGLKKETVRLDVLKKAFVKNPADFIKNFGDDVVLSEKYFDGYQVVLSDFSDGGVCKYEVKKGEDILFKKKDTAAVLTSLDLDILKVCGSNGAIVEWGEKMVFTKGETNDGVVFGGGKFDVSDKDQMVSLSVLLELGLKAKKEYKDLGFNTWIVDGAKIGGKCMAGRIENKMFVDVLNKYKQGCCEYVKSGNKVKLKGNMGWTTDGVNTAVTSDVEIVTTV